jgi:hypothetical protein
MAKIRARSASAAGAIFNGPRGGIGSCLAVHVLPLVPRLAGGRRTQRYAADGGAVPEMPYGARAERCAVIARQGAFLALPGDRKMGGNLSIRPAPAQPPKSRPGFGWHRQVHYRRENC